MKEIYSYDGYGTYTGRIKMSISLDIERELTYKDYLAIRKLSDAIIRSINQETFKNNPKVISQKEDEKQNILKLFEGYQIFSEETQNEYDQDSFFPWFIITTTKGKIKIGWRKRVIQIDWSDSIINQLSKEIFPEEDVTKFDKVIHAWGYEKAKEYIDKLMLL